MQNNLNEENQLNLKNFPKTLGNFFEKYIIAHQELLKFEGVKNFMMERENSEQKQISSKMEDFQKLCSTDENSKEVFQNFLIKEFILYLIQSSKVVDPIQYVQSIATYIATANEPEKMICNKFQFLAHVQS